MRIFASRASSGARRISGVLRQFFMKVQRVLVARLQKRISDPLAPLPIYIGTVVQHLFPHPTISDPGQHATGITPLTSCPAIQATSKSGRGDTWIFEIDGLMSSTHFTHGSRTSTVYSKGCLPAQIPLFMTPAHLHPPDNDFSNSHL